MSNHGHDGHFGPVTIGIFLVIGGAIWLVQEAWEILVSIMEFIL